MVNVCMAACVVGVWAHVCGREAVCVCVLVWPGSIASYNIITMFASSQPWAEGWAQPTTTCQPK